MIALFRQRGLIITDEKKLRTILYDRNYYRLSGYFRVFQKNPAAGDNSFKAGTTDEEFLKPFERDEKLRNIILAGTSRIELTLRSRFAYLLARDGYAYSYTSPDSYITAKDNKGRLIRQSVLSNIDKWVRMSNEVCIRHYRAQKKAIPIWAAVEAMPFDTVSRMMSVHIDTGALRELYRSMGIRTDLRTASEIVHGMVYLRNVCSHHGRLWHREMVVSVPTVKSITKAFPEFPHVPKSASASLMTLAYLVNAIDGGDTYVAELMKFLMESPSYFHGIATPLHWE